MKMKLAMRLLLTICFLVVAQQIVEAAYPTPTRRYPCQDDAASTTIVETIATDNLTAPANTDTMSVVGPGGSVAKALDYDGSSIVGTKTGSITSSGLTALTACGWMKWESATDVDYLASEWSGIDGKKVFGIEPIDTSGKFRVVLGGASTGTHSFLSVTDNSTLQDGEWHHVGFTYDGATQTVLIYINGVEETPTGSAPDTSISSSSGDRTTNIGGLINSNAWPDPVADIVVWEEVLTEAQIQEVMAEGQDSVSSIVPILKKRYYGFGN